MADRIIAICQGGPLDGKSFSVELNDNGVPVPLTSRAELYDCLYVPIQTTDLGEYPEGFANLEVVHTAAWIYRPES